MPLYDYECKNHGPFEAFRAMKDSSKPIACKICGEMAPRVLKAPYLKTLSNRVSNAMERNERSRHAPHVCHSGCNHSHSHAPTKQKKNKDGKPALQSYQGKRPWVIEHA